MAINVAVPKEISPGERRIAIEPQIAERLVKLGLDVLVQKGAGKETHIPDELFENAKIVTGAKALYKQADIVVKVHTPTEKEIEMMKAGAVVIGVIMGHNHPERIAMLRDHKITCFGMELIPRISRAQSMDVLSSQASVAGYKAALMGADLANRFFPMLTTAAGTIRPARVLVIGAGVAGLQAIATARRLGAMVEAYDVRAVTKEQVESLGAKFVQIDVKAEGEGGYARELTEEEKQQQREALARHIAKANIVITTAAIPGRASPKIVTEAMVDGMQPGSVVVDLAAEGGGNCELTKPGKTIDRNGVIVHGPLDVPSQVALHASEMFAKNIYNFLQPMIDDGAFKPDWEDEVIAESVITHDGEIKNETLRELVEGAEK
ncbi:MAG: Re/Si-specific NAD(P)(+) transhydrogenase subunit alpha [Gammaproteobacteria bacterium]